MRLHCAIQKRALPIWHPLAHVRGPHSSLCCCVVTRRHEINFLISCLGGLRAFLHFRKPYFNVFCTAPQIVEGSTGNSKNVPKKEYQFGQNTGCPDSNLYNLIMSDRQKYGSLIWFNGFPEELRCGNFT